MDTYLMYLRKSRSDNANETVEEVLAKHERILQDFAVRQFGHLISEENIFREVVSGETIEDRPKIKEVLSLIESSDINGVLVVEPQRLSRGDWEDGGKILSTFKYSNTVIITPTKTYDLNNKFDYKFFKMELSQGNEYLEYTKDILMRGRVASINEGNYIGSVAPYGYKKVIIDKSPTLEIVESEAKVINFAVSRVLKDGKGWSYIAHELDAMGCKPRRGEYWNPYTLKDICLNPVNIGKVKWNTRQTIKSVEDGKVVRKRPRNKKPIYVDGKHEPIIDLAVYKELVNKVGYLTREKAETQLINPFAGLLFCGTCGRAMGYRTYKNNDGSERNAPRLLCNNQVHCHTKSATFESIYQMIIAILEDIVNDFSIKIKNEDNKNYEIQNQLIENMQNELNRLDIKQNELYDFLEDGIYTKEVFLLRNQKLNEKREGLKKQLDSLKANKIVPIDYKKKMLEFKDVIAALKNDNVSIKYKNLMLKSVISRIDYYRNTDNHSKYDTSKPELKLQLKDF